MWLIFFKYKNCTNKGTRIDRGKNGPQLNEVKLNQSE